jgi:toxin ParE1/3/4
MTPRLVVRPEAASEIAAAAEWYEARLAGLGSEFLRSVAATLAAIERAPEQYPVVHRDVVRRALLRRFPLGVFYVAEAERTTVLAVLHVRRDPARWP